MSKKHQAKDQEFRLTYDGREWSLEHRNGDGFYLITSNNGPREQIKLVRYSAQSPWEQMRREKIEVLQHYEKHPVTREKRLSATIESPVRIEGKKDLPVSNQIVGLVQKYRMFYKLPLPERPADANGVENHNDDLVPAD